MKKIKVLHSVDPPVAISKNAPAGIEYFTYMLDKQLTKKGILSKVICREDSQLYKDKSKKRIIPFLDNRLENIELLENNLGHFTVLKCAIELEEILKNEYDIIHSQATNTAIFGKLTKTPIVTTFHLTPEYYWNNAFGKISSKNNTFVAISNLQKKLYESENFQVDCVIYNGIDPGDFKFLKNKDNFLLSLGRICPHKGQHHSINVAKKIGLDLIIAGCYEGDSFAFNYFKEQIEQKIDIDISQEEDKYSAYKNLNSKGGNIIYAGIVNSKQKVLLYAHAKTFLMPIEWEEPFGFTLVESMVSGTPVIGFNRGAILEVIEDGRTGYVVNDENEMIEALKNIEKIKPENCRKRVLDYFTLERMTDNYIELYKSLM